MVTAAIIGLGEAGRRYARGLRDAGLTVTAFDPYVHADDVGVSRVDSLEHAVEGADVVISLVGSSAAATVAEQAFAAMMPGAIFADFNTASPEQMIQIGALAQSARITFADVAVLAPVPRAGVLTPLMVSGRGADRFAEVMERTGAVVDSIAGEPGDAAGRKLLRSSFMKGFAAVVLESLAAADLVGHSQWLREQIARELNGDPHALIDRLIDGSREHAERRAHETEDAAAYLDSLGTPNWSTNAAHSWLSKLRDEPHTGAGASLTWNSRKEDPQE